jgi:tetratricopeptide (TPR) repeat protein
MFLTLKPKTSWPATAIPLMFAGALTLSFALTGCGRGDKSDSRHTALRAESTRSASDVIMSESQGIETTPTAGDPTREGSMSDPSREATYEEAEATYTEGNYAAAMELFARYTERKSENPWGYYMLGLSAWKAGDCDRAERAFEQSLALDSLHVKSYLNLSRVLLDAQRPDEALKKIDRALAIEPGSNVAYRLRGRALRQQGHLEDALVAYRRALVLDNEDAWAMNNLALILIEEKRFDEALPPLARAVELEKGIPIFRNNLGMALEGTGRFRAAEEAYQSAIDVDPSYFKASNNLSRVASVQEGPGLAPVDLEAIARSFVEEIAGWKEELAVRTEPEIMGPVKIPSEAAADTVVVRDTPAADGEQQP